MFYKKRLKYRILSERFLSFRSERSERRNDTKYRNHKTIFRQVGFMGIFSCAEFGRAPSVLRFVTQNCYQFIVVPERAKRAKERH